MLGGALVLNLEGIGAGSIQGDSGGGELELGLLDNDGLERPSRSAVRRRSGCGRRGAIIPSAGARGRAGGRLARGSSLVCAVGFLAGRGPADSRTAAAACEHNHEHECESPNRECALQWTVHSPQPHSSGVVGSAWVSVRAHGRALSCRSPLSLPLDQLSRCCLRASHTPSTTWAAPRTLIRSGFSTNHIPILRVLSGPTTHSLECPLGARNSMSPSPTVSIANSSISLLFQTASFSSSCSCASRAC